MKADGSIDLRGVCCPVNFVKTKLALEDLEEGEILEVILDEGEPIMNVPRSLKEEGHKIIDILPEERYFRLFVKKME